MAVRDLNKLLPNCHSNIAFDLTDTSTLPYIAEAWQQPAHGKRMEVECGYVTN